MNDLFAALVGFACLVGGSMSAVFSVIVWFGAGERHDRVREGFTFWGFIGYGLGVEITVALCGALLLERASS